MALASCPARPAPASPVPSSAQSQLGLTPVTVWATERRSICPAWSWISVFVVGREDSADWMTPDQVSAITEFVDLLQLRFQSLEGNDRRDLPRVIVTVVRAAMQPDRRGQLTHLLRGRSIGTYIAVANGVVSASDSAITQVRTPAEIEHYFPLTELEPGALTGRMPSAAYSGLASVI
jgi:hypothetical protein